jgi:flagellar basal body rod protein FlgB
MAKKVKVQFSSPAQRAWYTFFDLKEKDVKNALKHMTKIKKMLNKNAIDIDQMETSLTAATVMFEDVSKQMREELRSFRNHVRKKND